MLRNKVKLQGRIQEGCVVGPIFKTICIRQQDFVNSDPDPTWIYKLGNNKTHVFLKHKSNHAPTY